MAQKISVDYTVLNIRVHPHPSPEIYVNLFQDAYSEKRTIPLGSNTSAKISRLWQIEDDPLEGFVGEIAKFNDIDADSWINVGTGLSAEEDEVAQIHIPKDLRPNGKTFYFIFYPKCHLLISEIRDKQGSFSPHKQEKFFNYLFASEWIQDKYKAIDITVVPSVTAVNEILESKTLKNLDLVIHRPNPYDFEGYENEILSELEEQNAKVYEKRLVAQNGKNLTPSLKTKNQILVAAHNGKVTYTDVDPSTGLNRNKSTSETPFIDRDRYDPSRQTPLDLIKFKAREIVQDLKDRIK